MSFAGYATLLLRQPYSSLTPAYCSAATPTSNVKKNRICTPFGVRRRVGEPGRPVMPSCIHPNTYRLLVVPRLLAIAIAIDYGHGSGHCSQNGRIRTAGACLGPVGGNCTWSDSSPNDFSATQGRNSTFVSSVTETCKSCSQLHRHEKEASSSWTALPSRTFEHA